MQKGSWAAAAPRVALRSVRLRGCPVEPMDGGGRWGCNGRAAPDARFLAQRCRSVPLPATAHSPCPEGKRLCRAPRQRKHCKTPRTTQRTRAPAATRCPAELRPQPASPRVPPSSCWHRPRRGAAPQRHAEPSRG